MPVNADLRARLTKLVPYGFLVTRRWLIAQGVERHGIDNLVKSRQLITLFSGVYTRPETKPTWQGVVCSLQRMGSSLTVGGLTALQLQGFSHYLPLSESVTVQLCGSDLLPAWVSKLGFKAKFLHRSDARLFGREKASSADRNKDSTVRLPWGDHTFALRVSAPERAVFELLEEVPEKISFEHADQLMQGLVNLSPRRLENLLRRTRSIKVKRLFFWFAERQRHAWFNKLRSEDFDLGSGKRVLAKGGKFDKKYGITVPEEMCR
ncbi:MAG: type IV toxin-antitoxin system AbiEi family antitoxin domain-containing protein [Rhizomicrobium sp.]